MFLFSWTSYRTQANVAPKIQNIGGEKNIYSPWSLCEPLTVHNQE